MGAAHFFPRLGATARRGRAEASKADAAKAALGAQGDMLKALVKDLSGDPAANK